MSITEYYSALSYKEIVPTLIEEQNKNGFKAIVLSERPKRLS